MALLIKASLLLALGRTVSGSPYIASDITLTTTTTRTIFTCPCETTAYFAQTSPAYGHASQWQSVTSTTVKSSTSSSESVSKASTLLTSQTPSTATSSSSTSIISGQSSTTGTTGSSTSVSQGSSTFSSVVSSVSPSSTTSQGTVGGISTSSSATSSTTVLPTPFSVQVSVSNTVAKRASKGVGFQNGKTVLVDNSASAYAFSVVDGTLFIFGTQTSVGTFRDDTSSSKPLQQIPDGTQNSLLKGWTLQNGVLSYPQAIFCVTSSQELQITFQQPSADCRVASLTADNSPNSFNVLLGPQQGSSSISSGTVTSRLTTTVLQGSTSSKTRTTTRASTKNPCATAPTAVPSAACKNERRYEQSGFVYDEICDVLVISQDGPIATDFNALSYEKCADLCSKNPSCGIFTVEPSSDAASAACRLYAIRGTTNERGASPGTRGGSRVVRTCSSSTSSTSTTSRTTSR